VFVSVVIPTHNPNPDRLRRTLKAVRDQDFPSHQREIIVVDNGSEPRLDAKILTSELGLAMTVVNEGRLGLTPARIRGIRQARGEVIVFVDDDNVLARDYLSVAASRFKADPKLGACGGKALPEFETTPPDWTREFWHMLAIRDLGPVPLRGSGASSYPTCAPIGAGMAVRRKLALNWATEIEHDPVRMRLDRAGKSLASGGDNDLVLTVLKQGFEVEYVPELVLTHLVSARRTTTSYLARLNYASSRTWVQLLRAHNIRTGWTPISSVGATVRKARSFLTARPWGGAPEYIRWCGACGIFDGRVIADAEKRL
jgi:glycosyltransferase involved in cell wall biosynthesis